MSSPAPSRGQDPAGTFPPEAQDLLDVLNLGGMSTTEMPLPGADGPAADTGFLALPPGAGPSVPGYEILGELGRGGMGVVYKARQLSLNRLVAIKMIASAGRVTPTELIRFLAEAEAVAAVKHPNVVEVYHLGNWSPDAVIGTAGHPCGLPYFVMEYVGGGTLAGRLSEGPVPARVAAALVAAIARGVQAAHDAGIVHRDLKPANVLLAPAAVSGSGLHPALAPAGSRPPGAGWAVVPKVSDFGLAKRLGGADALTRTQAVMGTPAYMAPEQAGGRGKLVTPEADVYALGVILYECLTGSVPFHDEDALLLLRQVTEAAPVRPRDRVKGVPGDLELICLQCLEKEPHHRYATAAELADDLERFLAGRPVTVRPVSAVARFGRWARGNPAAAGLLALGLAVLVGAPAGVVWHVTRIDKEQGDTAAAEERERRAEEARRAAEDLAATRELYALRGTIRRRGADRPTGWTAANRPDLARAAALAGADPEARAELRSEAAATLLAPDLYPAEPVAREMTAAAAATSPDGSVVALGEFKARAYLGPVRVLLVDPATGQTVRELTFSPDWAKNFNQDGVRALAFSPDGRRLYAGTRGGAVHRFDLAAGQDTPARSWAGGNATVEALAVAADGSAVFGVCGSPAIRWAAETGREEGRFTPADGAWGVAVDPASGELVVSGGPGLYRVDPATMQPRDPAATPAGGTARVPTFLPGGRVLVAARADRAELVDPVRLAATARFTDPDLLHRAAHEESVAAVAAHPGGAYIATAAAGSADRVVKVWSVAARRRVASVAVPWTGPIALAWSGDGRYLLATTQSQTLRFEFRHPATQRVVGAHPYPLGAAAFAADGRGVAALGDPAPGPGATRTLFLTGTDGRPGASAAVPPRPEEGRPGLASVPGSGVLAVTGTGPGFLRWAPGGAVEDAVPAGPPASCPRYSSDGSTVWAVTEGDRVRAWDAKTGTSRGVWVNTEAAILTGQPALDALAVGRSVAVAGGRDGTVTVLNDRLKRVAGYLLDGDPIQAVAVTPDDRLAAAGTRGGRLRVVRLADGSEGSPAEAHPGGVTAAAVNRDGTLLATGGRDRAVRLWRRVGDGYEPLFTAGGLTAPVRGLEFAADGNRLLVLLTGEHAVRVWDLDVLKGELEGLRLGW